ncbi:2728_t:CDS:2 [Dentiscutata heterogama]|uniref:2728_t:CDS:1 n=1 Tax=Dentiscutata heterogama TaxID=1316150 RepID=A0ACA9MWS4_9GLOM|nr:2728_t:CDS:2 [Dentiscutata heterogama]
MQDILLNIIQIMTHDLTNKVENSPDDMHILFKLGEFYQENNQYHKSLQHLNKALKLEAENNITALKLRANTYIRMDLINFVLTYVKYWKRKYRLSKSKMCATKIENFAGTKAVKRLSS